MKPANTTIQLLSFNQRVRLVKVEISKRVNGQPESERMAMQARLWCVWLQRELSL